MEGVPAACPISCAPEPDCQKCCKELKEEFKRLLEEYEHLLKGKEEKETLEKKDALKELRQLMSEFNDQIKASKKIDKRFRRKFLSYEKDETKARYHRILPEAGLANQLPMFIFLSTSFFMVCLCQHRMARL